MDNYQFAVESFYSLYFQNAEGFGWEHRVSLKGNEKENIIEVRDIHGTVIRVKDEDTDNVWRRAKEELESYISRKKEKTNEKTALQQAAAVTDV